MAIPKNRLPTHPGEMLGEEILKELGITQAALAEHLGISVQKVSGLIRKKRAMTPDVAWLLQMAFGISAEFWMQLQVNYDLAVNRPRRRVKRYPQAVA